MALTISIEGKGVIANADNTTADTAGGSWGFSGSGGVAWGTTTDTYYYGTTSISMAISGTKNGWLYHDIGAGNELDFTPSTGTEAGQFVYIWVHCPTIGLTNTLANEGVSIRIGSGTGAYRSFIIAGNNGSNGWTGGWKCFVIDPNKTGSITDTGTPNLASIRYIGLRGATTANAKGDNFFVSQIAVGSGLRITGTSTTAWNDAVVYCTDLPNRAWGMLQEREGIYYVYGNIIIGDTTMTANTNFDDKARIIQFGISEYWSGTGTTFNTSLPTTACGITLEDDNTPTSYTTTFTDGVIVGTDNGRSGSTFIGNANENIFLDFSGLTNTGSDVNLYGTTIKSFGGAITLVDDVDHAYLGCNFIDCSQVDPVGAPVIRNCIFAETQDTVSALKWNNSIDIQDSAFIANTTGAGTEHDTWTGTESGTATATDGTGVTLTDSAATNFTANVSVNDIVYNETTGGYGTVTTITDSTHLDCAGGLSTGGWTSGDVYSITTPVSYTNLTFSGNTTDIANTTAPTDVVAISKAGTSDPVTKSGFTVIQGSVTVQVTVKDKNGTAIQNVQTAVYQTSDRTEIMNINTNVSGVASTTFAGSTPVEVEVRCRKASSTDNPKYKNFSSVQTIQSGTGLDLAVTMIEDTNNNATS